MQQNSLLRSNFWRAGSTLTISCLCLAFCIALPATAEASRPVLLPPTSAKATAAASPLTLTESLTNGTVGLDRESSDVRRLALEQAREYIQLRKGRSTSPSMQRWLEKCEKEMNGAISIQRVNENPFCRYEIERAGLTGGSRAVSLATRARRRDFANLLREEKFDELNHREYADILSALGSIGDADDLRPLAIKVAGKDQCLPPELTSALGFKMEELFPAADAIELAKKLYRKSADCGASMASGAGAFRLGLILIWQKQCQDVPALMSKTESIPEASQFHARARYWSYHCNSTLNNDEGKFAAKAALLKDYPLSFQNLAANGNDPLFTSQVLNDSVPNVSMRSLIRPDFNSYLRAAEALARAGSPHLAAELLDRNVNDIATIEPEVRLYTAAFLHHMGYSLTTFKVLSNLFQDAPRMVSRASMKLFFPLNYMNLVKIKEKQIDPLLILSLIRQESAFNPAARSSVGARGLMQVMPATARSIASVQRSSLFVPAINVGVGTKYFLRQLSQNGGDVELTLAAYNAGFNRVESWVKRYPTDNKLLFLDFIPYKETRDYVSSILRNYYWYVQIYSDENAVKAQASAQVSAKGNETPGAKVQAIMAANAGIASRPTPPSAAATTPTVHERN